MNSMLDQCERITIEDARTPKEGYLCKMNRWWVVVDGCVLLWRGISPQCNNNREITQHLVDSMYPTGKAEFFEVLYFPHRCS